MRFEIRGGGIAAILIGVGVLSGAVFMLGLLAGYDVGRESQSSQAEVATAYPLESPPAGAPMPAESAETAPASASSAPEEATASSPPAAVTPAAIAKAIVPKRHGAQTASSGKPTALADEDGAPAGEVTAPPSSRSSRRITEFDDEGDTEAPPAAAPTLRPAGPAVASARPATHRRPYNIQIQAVMDRTGANEMVHRLQSLGYAPHIVATQLSGQTWYKVEVGPYASQDEAAAAQEQLREKYNSTYGGGGSASNRAD